MSQPGTGATTGLHTIALQLAFPTDDAGDALGPWQAVDAVAGAVVRGRLGQFDGTAG